MKLTRKLVPAFAMLLVSAIMLTTASFAWFSTNDDVSATGMQVQASTAKNLVISLDGASFGTTPVTVTDGSDVNLTPISINCASNEKIGTDAKFFRVTDETLASVTYDTGAFSEDTRFAEVAAADGFYETFSVKIKVDGETGTKFSNLYVQSIDVTRAAASEDQAAVSAALRVAVTDGTTTYIYAPLGGTYVTGGSIDSIDGSGVPTTKAQTLATVADATYTFGEIDTTAKTFTIYLWYEGQDVNCKSANATLSEDLTIKVNFCAE